MRRAPKRRWQGIDLKQWLMDVLQGRGGEHIRLGPVDPIRAATLLHAIAGDGPKETGVAESFYAALEAAARAISPDWEPTPPPKMDMDDCTDVRLTDPYGIGAWRYDNNE